MEQNQSFYSIINNLYSQFTAETNPQDKLNIQKKIIVEVWKNTKDKKVWKKRKDKKDTWGHYSDVVTQTIIDCLSEKSKYNSSKAEFSKYLLVAIKYNVRAENKKKENKIKRNTHLELENQNKESYFITDIAPQSVDTPLHLTDIQKLLTIEDIRDDLSRIEEIMNCEKNNRKEIAAFLTRDILYYLKKGGAELLKTKEVYNLISEFDFLDEKIWSAYYFNIDELPPREVLAASMEINKKTAGQWMSRFRKRLYKNDSIQKIDEV